MIKNIIFDIGNVILNFNYKEILPKYTTDKEAQDFIEQYIVNSPEWLGYALIDTGYITKEEAISIVQDRTNHIHDKIIENFWNTYNNYAFIDKQVISLLNILKKQGYKIFLLSNINSHTHEAIKDSGLFQLVDGYVLSYLEHQIKPYEAIYQTLIERYNISPKESVFLDDNEKNINTANKLGFISKKVEPDNYQSIIDELNKLNIQI